MKKFIQWRSGGNEVNGMTMLMILCMTLVSFFAAGQSGIADPVPFPLNYYDHPVFEKALAYSKARDLQNAEKYWNEFALRYPDARPRYFELATVKMGLGKYSEAKILFDKGYLMNPFDTRTISEYMVFCALTGDMTKGFEMSNQLGKIVSSEKFPQYQAYFNSQIPGFTGSQEKVGAAIRAFREKFESSYTEVGPTDSFDAELKACRAFKGKSWEEIMAKTFSLKDILSKRGVASGAYHWLITDMYNHTESSYGAKGEWVYNRLNAEMIREYESGADINAYYKSHFGVKVYEKYLATADFDRALTLNNKLIEDVKEAGLFNYQLIKLLTSRTFTLYNLDRFGELEQIANLLKPILDQYKNPTFKAKAYETLCAAYSKNDDKVAESIKYGEEALAIIQKNKLAGEGTIKSLLSICYLNNNETQKGLEYAGFNSDMGDNYIAMYNVGVIFGENDQHDKALSYYKKSLRKYEEVSGSYNAQQKLTSRARLSLLYGEMARSYYVLKEYESVYNVLEEYKARTLSELIGGKNEATLSLGALKASLKPDEAYINYKMTSQRGFVAVVVTNKGVDSKYYDLGSLIQPVKKYFSEGLLKLDKELSAAEYRTAEYKPVSKDADEQNILIQEGDFALVTELYRKYLTGEMGKFLDLNPEALKGIGNTMSKGFWEHFIRTLSSQLTGVSSLYISADGPLHFIPFETMKNADGEYLAATHQIKMIPSATVWNHLKKRKYITPRKEIIAFGGAIYEEAESQAPIVRSIKEINEWQLKSYDLVDDGAPLTDLFKAMGYGKMNYLQGTLNEVNQIGTIFERSTIIRGKEMNEKKVKDLSASGDLKNYKVLHFATHGWVINSMPKVAGLAMSIPSVSTDGEDGRLIAKEVSQLQLNADMVMLSACQTGLGKLYGGEGVSGLSQSFLAAGANATIVSLWPVNDYATSVLVSELYRMVKTENLDYATALRKVKQNFMTGKYNTANTNLTAPIYWAPFVYNGI